MVACFSGCGQKSSLEGRALDAQGRPLAGVRVVAQKVQSGKAQFEMTTGPDGVFRFAKLSAETEYELIPYLADNIRGRSLVTKSAPAGQTTNLPNALPILFLPTQDGLLVRNTISGLIWLRDGGQVGKMDWDAAVAKARQISVAGFADWRLPTKAELRSLAAYGDRTPAETLNKETFTNIKAECYWTSDINEDNKAFAWAVNMADGKLVNDNKVGFNYNVLLVRSDR